MKMYFKELVQELSDKTALVEKTAKDIAKVVKDMVTVRRYELFAGTMGGKVTYNFTVAGIETQIGWHHEDNKFYFVDFVGADELLGSSLLKEVEEALSLQENVIPCYLNNLVVTLTNFHKSDDNKVTVDGWELFKDEFVDFLVIRGIDKHELFTHDLIKELYETIEEFHK